MGTFYSLLYVQLNPATQERLTVGMLLVCEKSGVILFDYSRRKLRIVTELNGPNAGRNLEWVLKGLRKASEECVQTSVFTQQYLKYLSAYQNNLLVVDAPRQISLAATEETFDLLYERKVDTAGRWKGQQ